MKTYGTIHYIAPDRKEQPGQWALEVSPHVAIKLKRIFGRLSESDEWKARRLVPTADVTKNSFIVLQDSDEVCEDLRWVLQRYPMVVAEQKRLDRSARTYRKKIEDLSAIAEGKIHTISFDLSIPVRPYQCSAAELVLKQGFLLLGDHMGLGKTATAIAVLSRAECRPALFVSLTHLPMQIKEEVGKFAPMLECQILKTTSCEVSRDADVVIVSYSKLAPMEPALQGRFKSVIFDEIQELRRNESDRYAAANRLARSAKVVLGMSGTPIYNQGGEIFNVIEILKPGLLGSREEFVREWCVDDPDDNSRLKVKDTTALGSYLRENLIMLRRTRKDVDRELPPAIEVVHQVEFDADVFAKASTTAEILAGRLLSGTFIERGQAAREFDIMLREATGVSKAPQVADFVRMLVEAGEPVVLFGYHHKVYDIWRERLNDLNPVFFTGNESPVEKRESIERFKRGETKVLIMSLRSGAGVDGLQFVSRSIVFGELDWSPAILDQCRTRADRDGQTCQVTAYYLVSSGGSDPVMATVLGGKRAQAEGIVDLGSKPDNTIVDVEGGRIREVVIRYLISRNLPVPVPVAAVA